MIKVEDFRRKYSKDEIVKLCRVISNEMGLDECLVLAITRIESAFDHLATRFEPSWKYFLQPEAWAVKNRITEGTERVWQAQSLGAMQVMGTVCREQGHHGLLSEVLERPELGIIYGCKVLLGLQKRYENEDAVIAAYNAGSARRKQNSQGVGFEWVNQSYVNKVKVEMIRLREKMGE